jgi:hypothetical protein
MALFEPKCLALFEPKRMAPFERLFLSAIKENHIRTLTITLGRFDEITLILWINFSQ